MQSILLQAASLQDLRCTQQNTNGVFKGSQDVQSQTETGGEGPRQGSKRWGRGEGMGAGLKLAVWILCSLPRHWCAVSMSAIVHSSQRNYICSNKKS